MCPIPEAQHLFGLWLIHPRSHNCFHHLNLVKIIPILQVLVPVLVPQYSFKIFLNSYSTFDLELSLENAYKVPNTVGLSTAGADASLTQCPSFLDSKITKGTDFTLLTFVNPCALSPHIYLQSMFLKNQDLLKKMKSPCSWSRILEIKKLSWPLSDICGFRLSKSLVQPIQDQVYFFRLILKEKPNLKVLIACLAQPLKSTQKAGPTLLSHQLPLWPGAQL